MISCDAHECLNVETLKEDDLMRHLLTDNHMVQTNLIKHDIDVGEAVPIRQRFHRISAEKRKIMDAEVKYMLDNNLAVPSSSSWASPCLLVEKLDKPPRCCMDFWKVNVVTKPDCYLLSRAEVLLFRSVQPVM